MWAVHRQGVNPGLCRLMGTKTGKGNLTLHPLPMPEVYHAVSCLKDYVFFLFPGLPLWHREVPRLGVESELQLQVYTTATATPDLRHACDLHCSLRQHQILNPWSWARDQTHILTEVMPGS